MCKKLALSMIFLTMLLVRIGPAAAAPDVDELAGSVIRLVCLAAKSTFSGSGFAIGSRPGTPYIVTNYHVVAPAPGRVMVYCPGSKMLRTRVLAAFPRIDLALLELVQPLATLKPLVLAPRSRVHLGQKVYALGFPEAADELSGGMALSRPEDVTVTDGIISRIIQRQGVRYYQTNADINHGNSGGPLVEENGAVIGINALSMGDLQAQGINAAIQVDELIPELERLGIPFVVRHDRMGTAKTTVEALAGTGARKESWNAGPIFYAVAVLLLLGFLSGLAWLWRNGRTHSWQPLSQSTQAMPAVARPLLRAVSGRMAGQVATLAPGEWLLIGRDPYRCRLVFPAADTDISRKHCRIGYDAATGRFRLVDCGSSNGTYLASGERLAAGREYLLQPGERFYLSKAEHGFLVEIE